MFQKCERSFSSQRAETETFLAACEDATKEIVHLTVERTGRKLRFLEDATLEHKALIKLGRLEDDGEIIVYYDPKYSAVNHLVAHECGHILRIWSAQEDRRRIPAIDTICSLRAFSQLHPEITRMIHEGISPEFLKQLVPLWHKGTIQLLVDCSADFRIETWLHRNYSSLRREQSKVLKDRVQDHLALAQPEIETHTPKIIFNATNAINYAFARFVSELLVDQSILRLYDHCYEAQFRSMGEQLFAVAQSQTNGGHVGDVKLARQWAELLGITEWFYWKPVEGLT